MSKQVVHSGDGLLVGRSAGVDEAFDDQPDKKRYADRIETVTLDSVFSWMQTTGMAAAAQQLDCAEAECISGDK